MGCTVTGMGSFPTFLREDKIATNEYFVEFGVKNEMIVAHRYMSDIVLREECLRALKPGEIRLAIKACGICGTDLLTDSEEPAEQKPFGHEMAGQVVEVGPGVDGLSKGQNVVIESATACGRCANCRNARQEFCTDIQSFFYLNHFGFAEQTIVPACSAIPCEDLAPDVASLSEPLGVAIDLVRLAEIQITSNVLILGSGPIGLMAQALVRRAGASRVYVSDFKSRTARFELAQRWGADDFIDPTETPLGEYDFGCDIDRVLVTAPPTTLPSVFQLATKGAIVAFLGIGCGEDRFCRFDANEFHFKKLQLRSSFASPALYTPLALRYLREGIVDGGAMISHRFPLSQLQEAMHVAANDPGAIKVIVTHEVQQPNIHGSHDRMRSHAQTTAIGAHD